jgi:hypothetical protein
MKCEDIMTRPFRSSNKGETVAVAATKMRDADVGFR